MNGEIIHNKAEILIDNSNVCDNTVNLQFRSRAPNLEHLSVFCSALHLVTNAKVKGSHDVSMITFNLVRSISFLFCRPLFVLTRGRQIQSPVGTENEGESSHFAM